MSTQLHSTMPAVARHDSAATTTLRAAAAARFRTACFLTGVVGIGVWVAAARWGYPGIVLFLLEAAVLTAGLTATTHWTRRPIAVLPGRRGFAIDFAMLTVCGLFLSLVFAYALALFAHYVLGMP